MHFYVIVSLLLVHLFNQSVAELSDDVEICSATSAALRSCDDVRKIDLAGDTSAMCDTNTHNHMTTSLALVPYDEDKVLPHERPSRTFVIAGHEFVIQQDWQQLGVAAVVWDSAVILAEYLHQHRELVENKNVLELGAGTGLTGLVAAALGANVTVTERAEALNHLNTSIQSNTQGKSWKIRAQVLDWTSKVDPEIFQNFQVIFGADIVYIEDTFEDLLRTIKCLAVDEHVLVLLSCRLRYDRDLRFLKMLEMTYHIDEIYFDSEKKIKIFSARMRS